MLLPVRLKFEEDAQKRKYLFAECGILYYDRNRELTKKKGSNAIKRGE